MSAFGGMVLTNRGRNLQAKAQAGAQLNFTRFGVGDGDLGSSSIVELNALKNQVKSINVTKLKATIEGKATVGMVLSNQDLVTGFYFREVGLFAQDPDVGEILYCYANAGATADYIPAGGGTDVVEKSFDVIAIVGTAANVTATLDSSLVYASAQDLLDHENDTTAHGLSDKISHSLATAVNDFLVASAAGQFVKKTLAEVKSILGLGSAAYKDTGVAGGVALYDDVETHLADTMYQTAGGIATAITLTGVVLEDGHPKTFIASVNNSGSATTINGLPLYKPSTVISPNLIAGKAYTVWYNVAGSCFFIKASATGTATPAQVLANVPFSNESDTDLLGTMPNRDYNVNAGYSYGTAKGDGAGNLGMAPITAAYYTPTLSPGGFGAILANDPNFIPANIPLNMSMFGLEGTNTNKKWASFDLTTTSGDVRLTTSFTPSLAIVFMINAVDASSAVYCIGIATKNNAQFGNGAFTNKMVYMTYLSSPIVLQKTVTWYADGVNLETNWWKGTRCVLIE